MAFKKNYIGKGTKVENLDIVKVTLKMKEANQFVYEYDGEEYLTFEVATLKQPDNHGKTHTAYISQKEE